MVDPTRDSESGSGSAKPSTSSKAPSPGMVASLERKYEEFIEFGKRKLHYYDPGVSDNDRFLMSFLIYFMFLLMVVFTADYLAQKTYEDSDSLGPLQHLEVEIVYKIQHDYFDMPVYVNRTSKTIWYDTTKEWNGQNLSADERIGGFGLQIDSVCTGFHEMVFLGVLVMGFRGVSVKLRAKWTVILLGIVFVENLFRIFALYPIALYWGRDFEEWFHHYWWHYGQYAFIMMLFGLWFFFVARKQIGPEKGNEEKGKDKKDTNDASEDGEDDPEKAGETKDEGDRETKGDASEDGEGGPDKDDETKGENKKETNGDPEDGGRDQDPKETKDDPEHEKGDQDMDGAGGQKEMNDGTENGKGDPVMGGRDENEVGDRREGEEPSP